MKDDLDVQKLAEYVRPLSFPFRLRVRPSCVASRCQGVVAGKSGCGSLHEDSFCLTFSREDSVALRFQCKGLPAVTILAADLCRSERTSH